MTIDPYSAYQDVIPHPPDDPVEFHQACCDFAAQADDPPCTEPEEALSGWTDDGTFFLLRSVDELLGVLIEDGREPGTFVVVERGGG